MVNTLHRLEVTWKKRQGVENRSLVHAARYIPVSPCAGLGFPGAVNVQGVDVEHVV